MMRQLRSLSMVVLGCLTALPVLAQETELLEVARRLATKLPPGPGKGVAVLGFAGDETTGGQFGGFLANKLNVLLAGQAKDARITNRSQVEAALRELGIKPAGDMLPSAIDAIAKRLNVASVVTGSYSVFHDYVSVDATLYECATGSLIGGHAVRIRRTPDLDSMLGKNAAPAVSQLTIPAGKGITVRLLGTIAAEKAHSGDPFRGTLDSPIIEKGITLIPRGAEVVGRINSVDGKTGVVLSLVSILTRDGQTIFVRTQPLTMTVKRTNSRTPSVLGGAVGSAVGGRVGTIGSSSGSVVTVAGSGGHLVLQNDAILDFRLGEAASIATGKPQ